MVSRRAVLEEENSHEREELLASMQEGQDVKGIVKNLTDYGAVDLGGVDGLLHYRYGLEANSSSKRNGECW